MKIRIICPNIFACSQPLNKVDVAFSLEMSSSESSISSVSHSPIKEQTMESPRFDQVVETTLFANQSPTKDKMTEKTRFINQSPIKEKIAENPPRFQYTFTQTDPTSTNKTYCINMASHVTYGACTDDEVSVRSCNDNAPQYSPGMTPRTNILSHMAKSKASWVEDTLQNRIETAHRMSPILIKGRNPNTFETPYEKNQRTKDTSTKGVRDGRRFDLLPISKYLAQSKREGYVYQETRLPLVRISSVQKFQAFYNTRQCYPTSQRRQRLPNTFFAQKDMFKPRELRSQPTRGEAAFVDIREQLPRLYKKQYNAPVVKMGRDQKLVNGTKEKSTISLPSVS